MTGDESAVAAAGMTTGATNGKVCDPMAAAARVRRIGGKPRCCCVAAKGWDVIRKLRTSTMMARKS